MTLHRGGKLEAAARLYRAILAAAPNDFDALHPLGVLLSSRRQSAEGIELIKRALALQPIFTGAHKLPISSSAPRRTMVATLATMRCVVVRITPDYLLRQQLGLAHGRKFAQGRSVCRSS